MWAAAVAAAAVAAAAAGFAVEIEAGGAVGAERQVGVGLTAAAFESGLMLVMTSKMTC